MALCKILNSRSLFRNAAVNGSHVRARPGKAVVRCTAEPAEDANKHAKIAFKLPRHVNFGENVCITGAIDTLGNWSVDACVPMAWNDGDVWTADVDMPSGSQVEYKYVTKSSNGDVLEWMPCDNLQLEVPDDVDQLAIEDKWDGEHRVFAPEHGDNEDHVIAQEGGYEEEPVEEVVEVASPNGSTADRVESTAAQMTADAEKEIAKNEDQKLAAAEEAPSTMDSLSTKDMQNKTSKKRARAPEAKQAQEAMTAASR